MTRNPVGAWVHLLAPRPAASLKLVCFPYAGGMSSVFRSWQQHLRDDVELASIRLPGREDRLAEPFLRTWAAIVPPIAEALADYGDRPMVFFGHSLGAVLSFEVVRWLRRRARRTPVRLIVSGRRAPHLPPTERIDEYTDADLIRRLRDLGGTPAVIINNPDFLTTIAPRVRADFELANAYVYEPEPPLNVPITAIGGTEDHDVDARRLDAWRIHTTAGFARHMFPGDHFFLHAHERAVLHLLDEELRRTIRAIESWTPAVPLDQRL